MKAVIFPGQGSQVVKMGYDFYQNYNIAKNIFLQADEILQYKLSEIIFNSAAEQLQQTIYSQLAIATTSIAILETLKEQNLFNINANDNITAGHSLGEYVALYYANIISFEDAIKLLQKRSMAMSNAKAENTSMASVLKLTYAQVLEVLEDFSSLLNENEKLEATNYNSQTQVVISGHVSAIEKFKQYLSNNNINAKCISLSVEKAFHSSLMQEAYNTFAKDIENFQFNNTKSKRLIMNSEGKEFTGNTPQLKQNLLDNLIFGVKWHQSIETIINLNITDFISIGPGDALTNMIKRDFPQANCLAINTIEKLNA